MEYIHFNTFKTLLLLTILLVTSSGNYLSSFTFLSLMNKFKYMRNEFIWQHGRSHFQNIKDFLFQNAAKVDIIIAQTFAKVKMPTVSMITRVFVILKD